MATAQVPSAQSGAGPTGLPSFLHQAPTYPWSERREIVPFLPIAAQTILDVGCGPGAFGAYLKSVDPTKSIWGVEPVALFADQARRYYDQVLVGTFPEALAHGDRRFDCIVFNDVLEHMVDPWAALRASAPFLSEDATIVASIPNVRYVRNVFGLVVRGDWTYTDLGILDRTHLRFFTKKTMRALFQDSGFDVLATHGINSIGRDRGRWARFVPFLLGDFSYTGFVIVARKQVVNQ